MDSQAHGSGVEGVAGQDPAIGNTVDLGLLCDRGIGGGVDLEPVGRDPQFLEIRGEVGGPKRLPNCAMESAENFARLKDFCCQLVWLTGRSLHSDLDCERFGENVRVCFETEHIYDAVGCGAVSTGMAVISSRSVALDLLLAQALMSA